MENTGEVILVNNLFLIFADIEAITGIVLNKLSDIA